MKGVGGFTFICVPSYKTSTVGLLKTRTVSDKQEYEVVFAAPDDLDSRQAFRRYSQFRALRETLHIESLPPFPKKRLICKAHHREERRTMLQTWLWEVVSEPSGYTALCSFLSVPSTTVHPQPGDSLCCKFLTHLYSDPHKKLSALKDFDSHYFSEQPILSSPKAQIFLRHLVALFTEQFVGGLAIHVLTKLLTRDCNRNAGTLLEEVKLLPEDRMRCMHLERVQDVSAFQLLEVLEMGLAESVWPLAVNCSDDAITQYRHWQRPVSAPCHLLQSAWTQVQCTGVDVSFRLNAGCVEVKASAEISASLSQVLDCFTQPYKRKLWDLALADITIHSDQRYTFEIEVNGVRESWCADCTITKERAKASARFFGDFSEAEISLIELKPFTAHSGSDTEEESPAVTVRLTYTDTVRKALARLYLSDVKAQLASSWEKFRTVAEGDLSPTVLTPPSLKEVVRPRSLRLDGVPKSDVSPFRTIQDVARDRLARRMFA